MALHYYHDSSDNGIAMGNRHLANQLNPNDFLGYFNLTQMLIRKGQYHECLAPMNTIKRAFPTTLNVDINVMFRMTYAICLYHFQRSYRSYRSNKFSQVIEVTDSILKTTVPNIFVHSWWYNAMSKMSLHKYREALSAWRDLRQFTVHTKYEDRFFFGQGLSSTYRRVW